jgi:hypothetical protein
MAAPRVERFVLDHSQDPSAVTGIRSDLDAVAADSQFDDLSKSLTLMIRDGSIGLGLAKAANQSALTEAFSDRREARRLFGQPLAPMDKSGLPWVERPTLVQQVQAKVSGPPDDRAVLVLGGELRVAVWTGDARDTRPQADVTHRSFTAPTRATVFYACVMI